MERTNQLITLYFGKERVLSKQFKNITITTDNDDLVLTADNSEQKSKKGKASKGNAPEAEESVE